MKKWMLLFSLLFACMATQANPAPEVSFTLHNNTLASIPLIIPNVMNPNLNPMSNSGVDLEPGQEVFFIYKKKRYLLLKVTEDLEGKTLEVGTLINERKRELGLE